MLLGYYGYYMYWDPTYMLVLIGAVICLIASARVKSTYAKYERIRSRSGKTGAQVAEEVLYRAGVKDVAIARTSGHLSDHYNPKDKTLYLSDTVYNSTSVAAIGVACHEAGHAIQHDQGYFPLSFRNTLVPENAPRLIPVYGHQYVPMMEMEELPVISVCGADVIFYAQNLEDFMERITKPFERHEPVAVEGIPFWSEYILR